MKTLFLLRHAKSSWDNANLPDFERPLNVRGFRAAPFMGELMARKGFAPSVILCSPSLRAKETALLVKEAGGFSSELVFDDRIYEASPQSLLQVVAGVDNTFASAMLVGHNPGIEGFIRYLTGNLEPMPTAALAVIELSIDKWDLIDEVCGELQNVYRPKDDMR